MDGKSSGASPHIFPNRRKMGITFSTFHDILVAHYGALASRRKLLARDAEVSERTAENWLAGKNSPQVCSVAKIARSNAAFRDDYIDFLTKRTEDAR